MTIKDNKILISKKTSDRLRHKVFGKGSGKLLGKEFDNFLSNEVNCASDISRYLYGHNKYLLDTLTTVLDPQGELSPEAKSLLSSLLKGSLQFSMTVGLIYGKAKIEDKIELEFNKSFEDPSIQRPLNKDDFDIK